jgi:hypothetical protein
MKDFIDAFATLTAAAEAKAKRAKESKANDDEHRFDVNSKKCKSCKSFYDCNMYDSLFAKVDASNYSEEIKAELFTFLMFIHRESFFAVTPIEELLKSPLPIGDYHQRITSLNTGFKHFKKLSELLNTQEIEYITSVIYRVHDKIANLFIKINNDNGEDLAVFKTKLCKSDKSTKNETLDKMTKEELLDYIKTHGI